MLQTDSAHPPSPEFPPEMQRLLQARHHDPFSVLGKHGLADRELVRAFIPGAAWVRLAETGAELERVGNTDLFEWHGEAGQVPDRYRLLWCDSHGAEHEAYDPYCFLPQLSEYDLHLFAEGKHWHIYRFLGAHKVEVDGVDGRRARK